MFDGFCGTGMTGVAAQLCGDIDEVSSLGYRVHTDGTILQKDIDSDGEKVWIHFSTIGERKAFVNDLSTAATFISSNYSDLFDISSFATEALNVIDSAEKELNWIYYQHQKGTVLSAVWSDVFICPNCAHEFIFWEASVKDGKMNGEFPCPNCGIIVGKASSKSSGAVKLERSFTSKFDPVLGKIVTVPKFALVEQTIKHGITKKKFSVTFNERKEFGGCQLNNDTISFQLPLTWNLAKSAIVRSTISRVLDTTIDFLLKRANQCLCLPLFCSRYTVCDLL